MDPIDTNETKDNAPRHQSARKPRDKITRSRKSEKPKMTNRWSTLKSKHSGDKATLSRTTFGHAILSPKKFPRHHVEENGAASLYENPKKFEKITNQIKIEVAVKRRKPRNRSGSNGSSLHTMGVEKRNGRPAESQPRHRKCYTNSNHNMETAKTKKQLQRELEKDEGLLDALNDLKWNSSSEDDVKLNDITPYDKKDETDPPEKNPSQSLKSTFLNNCESSVKQSTQANHDSENIPFYTFKQQEHTKLHETPASPCSNYFCEATDNIMTIKGSNINGVKILLRGDLLGALNCLFPQLNLVPSKSDPKKPTLDPNFSYFSDSLEILTKAAEEPRKLTAKKMKQSPESSRERQENEFGPSQQRDEKALEVGGYHENSISTDAVKPGIVTSMHDAKGSCEKCDTTDQVKKSSDGASRAEYSRAKECNNDQSGSERHVSAKYRTPLQRSDQKVSPDKQENLNQSGVRHSNRCLYSSVLRSSVLKDNSTSYNEENKSSENSSATWTETKTTPCGDQLTSKYNASCNGNHSNSNQKPIRYDLDELERDIVAMIDKLLDEPDEFELFDVAPIQKSNRFQSPTQTERLHALFKLNNAEMYTTNQNLNPSNRNQTQISGYCLQPETQAGINRSPPNITNSAHLHTLDQQNPSNTSAMEAKLTCLNYPPVKPSAASYQQAVVTSNTSSTNLTPFSSSSFTQLGVANYYHATPPQSNISDEMLTVNQFLASRSLYNQYAISGTVWNGYPLHPSTQQTPDNYTRPNPSRQATAMPPRMSANPLHYWEGCGPRSIISVTDLEQQALEQYSNSDESLNARYDILEKEAEEQYE